VPKLKFDLHMLGDQLSYQVGQNYVEVGTNAKYGALHQFGGLPSMAAGPAAVPARPWLGLSADDERDLTDIVQEYLDEIVSGA